MHVDKSICNVPHLHVSCLMSTIKYRKDAFEDVYMFHVWTYVSCTCAPIYPMYINRKVSVCVRVLFCLVVISHKSVLGR